MAMRWKNETLLFEVTQVLFGRELRGAWQESQLVRIWTIADQASRRDAGTVRQSVGNRDNGADGSTIQSIACWARLSWSGSHGGSGVAGPRERHAALDGQFTRTIRPFLETYCVGRHGQQCRGTDGSEFRHDDGRLTAGRPSSSRCWASAAERCRCGSVTATPQERRTPSTGSMPSGSRKSTPQCG